MLILISWCEKKFFEWTSFPREISVIKATKFIAKTEFSPAQIKGAVYLEVCFIMEGEEK
jgi:hypothetical protein